MLTIAIEELKAARHIKVIATSVVLLTMAGGQALHPVMDSTSPQHQGWQVWDPHPADVFDRESQPWQHGNHSPEDLSHLTLNCCV